MRRLRVCVVLAVAATAGVVEAWGQPASPTDTVAAGDGTLWTSDARLQSEKGRLARVAFEAGRIDDCLAHLGSLVDEDPALPPPHLLLAQIALAQGQVSVAAGLLEVAAWQYKQRPDVFLLCGEFELHHGRLANAWVHFQRALSLKPPADWPPEQHAGLKVASYRHLATIAERRADWNAAIETLAELHQLQPTDTSVLERWGQALFISGQSVEALAKFDAAFQLNDKLRQPELAMATLSAKQGRFQEAESWFTRTLEKYPDDGLVHFEHASALLRQGRTDEATAAATRAERSNLSNERLRLELQMIRGIAAVGAQDYATAEAQFDEVLRKSPGHEQALRRLPLVLVEQQNEAKQRRALDIAKINAKKHPHSAPALATLAWVQYRLGKIELAQETLKEDISPTDPESLYLLAKVMVEMGDIDRATPLIRSLASGLETPGWFPHRSDAETWLDGIIVTLD